MFNLRAITCNFMFKPIYFSNCSFYNMYNQLIFLWNTNVRMWRLTHIAEFKWKMKYATKDNILKDIKHYISSMCIVKSHVWGYISWHISELLKNTHTLREKNRYFIFLFSKNVWILELNCSYLDEFPRFILE